MSAQAAVSVVGEPKSAMRAEGRAALRISYKPLLFMVLLSLPFRVYWIAEHAKVMTVDGSEYARMAENLTNGQGLVGNFEGPETMYTPFFSVLTAGVYLLHRNSEVAAHVVSLIFGAALVAPVFLIALHMYGKRVAYLCAGLIAFHPMLIKLSASIYNENVYLLLLLFGMYFAMRCLESQALRDCALVGLFFGLAYLTRPEAFAYPALFAVAVFTVALLKGMKLRKAAIGLGLIAGMFLIVALPYIAFLYKSTGHVRLEGKWDINYTMANRIRAGMTRIEAAYGLGPDLSARGPLLDPFRFAAFTPYPKSLANKAGALLAMAKLNRWAIYEYLLDYSIGAPFLWALALLGLFRKAWTPRRLLNELILIAMAASVLFLLATSSSCEFRYILPLVPLTALWAAKGIDEFGRWTQGVVTLLRTKLLPNPRSMGAIARLVTVLLVLAVALRGSQSVWIFENQDSSFADVKPAGLWLRQHSPAEKRIATFSTVFTYYSGGTIIGLPYASPEKALQYVAGRNVDFIMLDSRYARYLPEIGEWIRHGIPDSRAHLIFQSGTTNTNEIQIYRWDKTGSRS